MSKSMIIALMITLAFAVIYITSCVVHAQEEEYEILYPETSMVDGVPYQIFNEVQAREIKFVTVDAEVIEEEDTEETTEEEQPSMTYLGEYTLTAYEYTGNPTASGEPTVAWWTVACNDPDLWLKKIYIEGYGTFYVCDRGGMPSNNILDIYLGDYNECIQFGVRTAKVYVYE